MSTDPAQAMSIIEDATCTFCGCLCDDIALVVDGQSIAEARNACSLGERWFFRQRSEHEPACSIEGRPATLEEGIERAARILHAANYPLVFGLDASTSAAQRAAVSLADWAGACVDPAHGIKHGPTVLALQEVGQVTCTLGEVKNRGDLIIFWGSDPVETHPRHLSRFSLEPVGTFLQRGRRDRTCIVVDSQETATSRVADQFIAIKAGREFEALWTLRALAKGVALDDDVVEAQTGASLEIWRGLMDRMKQARYGVFFSEASQDTPFDSHQCSYALLALVRDLNDDARFVCVPLGLPGNAAGADNVLTWQTGYPFAVSLARGFPRFGPRDYNAQNLLDRGECDAVLIVGGDRLLPGVAPLHEHLRRIPTVVLDSLGVATADSATVVLHTATYGINTSGTVYRVDGVPIPIRQAMRSRFPSDEDVLKRIERRLREIQAEDSPQPDHAYATS